MAGGSLWLRWRRWWNQDRIRLSAADLAPTRPRVGDRLEICGRLFLLSRRLGRGVFETLDEQGVTATVHWSASGYRLIHQNGESHTFRQRDVLLYPSSSVRL